jgi:hypothetical protein
MLNNDDGTGTIRHNAADYGRLLLYGSETWVICHTELEV